MKVYQGKKLQFMDETEMAELRHRHARCLIDVGTGDGRYPYHWALEHPGDLAIGIDAVADAMEKLAVRSRRKPGKGGAPNLRLAVGGAEGLPGPFAGWADEITVLFPWGSLLRALVEPLPSVLQGMAALGKPGARFVALLNTSIFRSDEYLERLGLPALSVERAKEELIPAYRKQGIDIHKVQPLAGGVPHRTTWGQRLVKGSLRPTLLLEGEIRSGSGGGVTAESDLSGATEI